MTFARAEAPNARNHVLAGEIFDLEANFGRTASSHRASILAAVANALHSGDDALLGRALSLRARVEIREGRTTDAVETVEAALAAFGRLAPATLLALSGPYAEAWRVAGNGQLWLGNVAIGLPLLERAVAIAEAGVRAGIEDEHRFSAIVSASALVRCLNNLGYALTTVNELKGATKVLRQALAVADAHPHALEDVPDDIVLTVGNLAGALQRRAEMRLAIGEDPGPDIREATEVLDAHGPVIAALKDSDAANPRVTASAKRHHDLILSHQWRLRGDLDRSLDGLNDLLANEHESLWQSGAVQLELAEIKLARDEPEAALALGLAALDIFEGTQEIEGWNSV